MDYSKSSQNVDSWIQERFLKRECICIVPTSKDSNKCGCGRYFANHYYSEGEEDKSDNPGMRWSISRYSATYATDAFGTLSFQGVHSSNKSQYIRLDFATDPLDIWHLLVDGWGFEPPKLVISVAGGCSNFEIQPTLMRSLRTGLLNAAKTTNAWIITSGIRSGAVKHIMQALSENFSAKKIKFTVIGILSWGLLKRSDDLVNRGGTLPYYPQNVSIKSRSVTLCEGHNCFLLVDNGTVGRSGGEQFLRRRFEDFLKQKTLGKSSRFMPMVGLILGGGRPTIQAVLTCVSSKPPVPVVVCSGTGRAADVLTLAHKLVQDDKDLDEVYKRQLVRMIEESFALPEVEAIKVYKTVLLIVKRKDFVNIFSGVEVDDQEEELDIAILNALLKDHNLSPVDQLSLLLTWNREDLAREIFEKGHDWPEGSLDQAMTFALMYDRVGFVKLLLENGIAMDKFLTITRLEDLYNTDRGPTNTLRFILQDVVIDARAKQKYNLPNIGLIIEKLMGGGFRSTYCRKEFRRRYKHYMLNLRRQTLKESTTHNQYHDPVLRKQTVSSGIYEGGFRIAVLATSGIAAKIGVQFNYPFHELFLWAVLTKRHEMAMCMWKHGEEPLAKALIGYKLNKMLAKEAEDDYFKVEVCEELRKNAQAFKTLAYQLLEQCYEIDDDLTFQLLTYELKHWSKKNCISLAALANHKSLLALPCCQMLMADLWLGGMRIRKNAGLKVFLSAIFPPLIFLLPFKTQEQLLYQPQTEEEFLENRPQLNTDDESTSDSEADSSDDERSSDIEGGINYDTHGKLSEAVPVERTRRLSRLGPAVSSSAYRLSGKFAHNNSNQSPSMTLEFGDTTLFNGDVKSDPSKDRRMSLARSSSMSDLQNSDQLLNAMSLASHLSADQPHLPGEKSNSCHSPKSRKRSTLQIGKLRLQSIISINSRRHRSCSTSNKPDKQQLPIKQNKELTIKKKLQEFYQAPIACFWSFVIGYIFFLGTYTYTVLVKTTEEIYWPEYYVIAFITTFAFDQIRRVLLQEPKSFYSKLNVYSQKTWDMATCIACLMFFVALFLRVSEDNKIMQDGRVLYCCNIAFWYMRCLHLLTVSSALGPYIFMYGKMVVKMCLLSTILFVVLLSFGIVRQSILVPDQTWSWSLLQDVVYKPYFMLYGELYADHIDDCGDNGFDCTPGFWLTPIFMTVYLLLTIIVFVNMMISTFNYVFVEVQSNTHLIWQIQRYDQVMEYEQQPFTPPPFIILADIYLLCKYLYRRIWKRNKVYHFEHSLKLYLTANELDKLHDFEMCCLKALMIKSQNEAPGSVEEQLKRINEKIEALSQKIDDRYDQWSKDQVSFMLLNDKCHRVDGSVPVAQSPFKDNPVSRDMTFDSSLESSLISHKLNKIEKLNKKVSMTANDEKLSKNVTWASQNSRDSMILGDGENPDNNLEHISEGSSSPSSPNNRSDISYGGLHMKMHDVDSN